MKKLFILILVSTSFAFAAWAQDGLKQATNATSTAGFNIKNLTTSILNKLVPALKITDDQKPGVTDAISGFLVEKSEILPLKQSDVASYTSKQNSLFSTLKSKLGSVLTGNQFTKFLGMKPKKNDTKNALWNLFF